MKPLLILTAGWREMVSGREAVRHFAIDLRDIILIALVILVLCCQFVPETRAQGIAEEEIGMFTAVEGQVSVAHPGIEQAVPPKLQDGVQFKDVIETDKESRTKALLNDDSLLTVGEHSRVEITEYIYDPGKNRRSVVVNLIQGKVRALVGKVFSGTGSKFEIHTPSAVAAARGTYFVVWHVEGVSGIANIGAHGAVDFQSGGSTVRVEPGNFSLAAVGGAPPSPAAILSGPHVPEQVAAVVRETTVQDTPKPESPREAVLSLSGQSAMPLAGPLLPGGPLNATGQPSGNITSSVMTGSALAPTTTVTVPAVTSGASGSGSLVTTSSPPTPILPPSPPPVLPPPPPVPPPVINSDHGLHLGQHGLEPGHGGQIPGHGQNK